MQYSPKIYIIGAGAIGRSLAVFLKQSGKDVVLVRRHAADCPDAEESIAVRLGNGEVISERITVRAIAHYNQLDGIVVLTSKSYGNPVLAERLKEKMGDSPLVILQNGLNVERPFIQQGFRQIYRCVLFATSQFVSSNMLQFKPVSASPIGMINGNAAGLAVIVTALYNNSFPFKAEPEILSAVWTKTIINSVFNSVCPLLEIDNGIFYRDANARAIAGKLVEECIGVAATQNVLLDAETVMENLLRISQYSEGQLISTYQDILHHRETEIDTLNMAIAELADKADTKPKVTATRLLGEMIRIKSGLF